MEELDRTMAAMIKTAQAMGYEMGYEAAQNNIKQTGIHFVHDTTFTVCNISFDLLEKLCKINKLEEFSQEMQAIIDRYEEIANKSD